MARRKLEIVLAGDEKGALRAMGATEKAAGGMGKAVLAAGAVVAAAAAGAAVGLFKIGSAFDEQYDQIRVGTGATGDALKGLQGDFKAVLTNVPASFADAGTAVADLNTRLGLTGPQLQERSAQFLELSRITKTDVAGNIANLTRVFGDWGIAAEDQAATLDKVYRAAQGSGAGLEQLSSQVVQFGAPLRQLGFGLDESLAILGKFEKEGVNTELVLGSMRQALGRMAKAGEGPIETFRRVTGEIKAAGSAGEANALALEMFGARAGPDMAAAIREGRFELGDLLTTISGGSDTIMQAGKDTQDFGEKWTMFKNRVLVALEPIAMRVFDAMGSAMDSLGPIVGRLVPQVTAFVRDVLGGLAVWWEHNGPTITAGALSLAGGVRRAFDMIVSGVQFVIRNWDRFKLVFAGVVAFLLPGFAVLGVQAMLSATKQAAAWLMTQTATIRAAAVHSAHIAVFVAKFAVLGVQALLHAGKVAAAWLIAMGPIGLVIAAVAGLVALVIIHWDTIKRVTLDLWNKVKAWTGDAMSAIRNGVIGMVQFVVDKILWWAETIVGAAATAFSWVPGLGGKLREAEHKLRQFRDETNAALEGIKDKTVNVKVIRSVKEIIERHSWGAGDGPGGPVPGRGGTALRRVQSIIGAYPGLRITSTYRSPAENRRVGGSPTSYHMDRWNPAVDIGGPTHQLDRIAGAFRAAGGWRELLWRTKGHFDHVHVAHSGGMVSPTWPTLAGLRADERPVIAQVGERIVPRGHDGASSDAIHLHFHGPVDQDGVRWVVRKIAEAKRKGYVGV